MPLMQTQTMYNHSVSDNRQYYINNILKCIYLNKKEEVVIIS